MSERDVRDAGYIRGRPDRQDQLVGIADDIGNALGLAGMKVSRLNPATATVAKLRCDAEGPAGDEQFTVRAMRYVQDIRAALGWEEGQVFEFAPDPIVQRTSTGARIVQLQQLVYGVPVFQMVRTVVFAPNGRITMLKGDHAPIPQTFDTVPTVTAVAAVTAAGIHLASPEEEHLEPGAAPMVDLPPGWAPRGQVSFAMPSQPSVLDASPFLGSTPASLVAFYQGPATKLGWQIRLTAPATAQTVGTQWRLVVEAQSEGEPRILMCRQTSHTACAGDVFPRDPGRSPRTRVQFPLSPSTYRLPVRSRTFPNSWCTKDRTEGPNVRAYAEETGETVRGTDQGGTTVFTSATDLEQPVINAFYFCNVLHDFFELLGFDARAGNFESGSATATGAPGDPVLARTTNRPIAGLAYMVPRQDGQSPELGLGKHQPSDRHSALDLTVVAHEYAHGVMGRLVGGNAGEAALDAPQSAGLSEGFADFFALSYVNFNRGDEDELQVWGDWVSGQPGGMRRSPYDSHYPGRFGELGQPCYRERHDIGELWCAALMELLRRWEAALGRDKAYRYCWQAVMDSFKMFNEAPSLLDARNALEEALEHLGDAQGQTPADDGDSVTLTAEEHAEAMQMFETVFAHFGMGHGATTNGPSLEHVVPSTRLSPRRP